MKQPIELDDGNILKYPKSLFTKEEVIREKKEMGTPSAWKFEQDTENYFLLFSKRTYNKVHKYNRSSDTSKFSKGYWIEEETIPSFLK